MGLKNIAQRGAHFEDSGHRAWRYDSAVQRSLRVIYRVVGLAAVVYGGAGCASRRQDLAEPVYVANGSGERCYEAVRGALEPLGIMPHCLGSVRFGIAVDRKDEARARAALEPVCRGPELYLVMEPETSRR
jgi:hypothetical protein